MIVFASLIVDTIKDVVVGAIGMVSEAGDRHVSTTSELTQQYSRARPRLNKVIYQRVSLT